MHKSLQQKVASSQHTAGLWVSPDGGENYRAMTQTRATTANHGPKKLFHSQKLMKHLMVPDSTSLSPVSRQSLSLILPQRLQRKVTIWDLSVQSHSSLVGPAPGHVADRVAASPQHQHGQIKTFDKLHTLGMTCSKGSGEKGESPKAQRQTFQ